MIDRKKTYALKIRGWMLMIDRKKLSMLIIQVVVSAIVAGLVSGFGVPYITALTSQEKKIRSIIEQEAKLMLEGNIEELISLFDEDAFIRDVAGGNTEKEIIWHGKYRIAERYRNQPEFIYLKHEAIEITISSDKTYARVSADTIGIYKVNGIEVKISSNQGEKWTLKKINGKWKITSFTYNLP